MCDGSHTRNSDRREIDAYRFGGLKSLLDASPDGWAGQVISGKKQSRHGRGERFKRFHDLGMAQIVLWQGARVTMQVCRYRLSRDAEDARDFGANGFLDFLVAQFAKLGIRCTACKAGEASHSIRRAPGEERGIKHRAENAQPFAARHQETKSVWIALNLFAAIACGHNCDRRIFNPRKQGREFIGKSQQDFRRNIRRRGDDNCAGRQRFAMIVARDVDLKPTAFR